MPGRYYVIDNTGGSRLRERIAEDYHPIMANLIGTEDDLPKSCDGDAFVLRDWLVERGYEWGRDFYIRKRKDGEPE